MVLARRKGLKTKITINIGDGAALKTGISGVV